jgi:hypothetical protein
MELIIGFFILCLLFMPLGAAINEHKEKVRRRQHIEDTREAIYGPAPKPLARQETKPAAKPEAGQYRMYGAQL